MAIQWHPLAQQFAPIEGEDWERFKEGLKKTGGNQSMPILYRMKDGKAEGLDGMQRYKACRELRLKPTMKKVSVPDEQVGDFILRLNVNRRHIGAPERRKWVVELRKAGESIRTIAEKMGTSKSAVQRDIEQEGIEVGEVKGRNKKTYRPKKKKDREAGDDAAKGKKAGKELFRWSAFDRAFAPVAKAPDIIAERYPGEGDSLEFREATRALQAFADVMEQWKVRLTKDA